MYQLVRTPLTFAGQMVLLQLAEVEALMVSRKRVLQGGDRKLGKAIQVHLIGVDFDGSADGVVARIFYVRLVGTPAIWRLLATIVSM